jgi:hypothetical protein
MLTHSEKLVLAIKSLHPEAEFSIVGGDYSTVKWDVLDGDAPTQKEIDAAIKQIKAEEDNKAEADATAKAALLDRLGITADEAKLLLS